MLCLVIMRYFVYEILNSVWPLDCLRVTLSVGCCDWFLVHGIFLPATQLAVIVVENILQRSVGNLTSLQIVVSDKLKLVNIYICIC